MRRVSRMEKLQFLLLDAGPIIKLFSLSIWDSFIKNCDVTVSQIVADQAKYASQEFEDIRIDLEPYKQNVKIIDVDPVTVGSFYDKFNLQYKADIHPGEKETLAFLCSRTENWQLCSADGAVFRALAILGRAQQGISLEELLNKIGLSRRDLEWKYTRKFREKYTHMGQMDSIQDKGFS